MDELVYTFQRPLLYRSKSVWHGAWIRGAHSGFPGSPSSNWRILANLQYAHIYTRGRPSLIRLDLIMIDGFTTDEHGRLLARMTYSMRLPAFIKMFCMLSHPLALINLWFYNPLVHLISYVYIYGIKQLWIWIFGYFSALMLIFVV